MRHGKTNTLIVKTPEGIAFSLLLASPITRFVAWLVDLACIGAATSIVGTFLTLFNLLSFDLARALSILAFFVLQIGYGIGCEWYWRGQTLGKRLVRLRVVDVHGLRLQFSQIVLRNLVRFIDILPACYLAGGLTSLVSKRAQRLGDIVANTIVIRTPKIETPNLDQILSGKYNSLRAHPHLEARLRQRVSPEEARIALQAILRREQLEPQARVELFKELADHFRQLVEFPPETVEFVSDEQYVRNVIEIVFRKSSNSSQA